jgi:hypothetical protein
MVYLLSLKNKLFPTSKEKIKKYCRLHRVDDTGSYLKELSPEIKDCLSAIGGAESADLLGVESVSFSMPFLDFSLPCCKQQAFCYTNVPSVSTAVGAPGLECNKKISALSFSSPLLLLIFVSN